MKINLLAVFALTFLTFSACKKDNKNSSDPLTSRTWKRGMNDKNTSTNPKGTVSYYAVKNCEKDDTFKFGSDGNLFLNRSSDQCEPNESQTETQTYTLNRTTKELVINGTKFTLAEESDSQIKYYAVLPPHTGFQYLIFLLQ